MQNSNGQILSIYGSFDKEFYDYNFFLKFIPNNNQNLLFYEIKIILFKLILLKLYLKI